jgi:hypothetical protein
MFLCTQYLINITRSLVVVAGDVALEAEEGYEFDSL